MGRPRSEDARQRALEATVESLLSSGVDGVTIEDVANRSGVARSTIYRHFGSLECLVSEAFRSKFVEYPTPDTGSLADDLQEVFDRYGEQDHATIDALMPLLLEGARREPSLQEILDRVLAERQRPLRTVIKLAQARSEIDPDLDVDVAMALLVGPINYRKSVQGLEIDDDFVETVLPAAVAALRSTAS